MKPVDPKKARAALGRVSGYILAGLMVVVFMVGGFGVWAATTDISVLVLDLVQALESGNSGFAMCAVFGEYLIHDRHLI